MENVSAVMSLPNGFKNSDEYFYHAIEFLKQNSWIYRESNTMFLKSGILNEMPRDYKYYFTKIQLEDLNQFPYVQQPLPVTNLPTSIKKFRNTLSKLLPEAVFIEPKIDEKEIQFENLKKINVKKQHEIKRLAALVNEILKLCKNDSHVTQAEKYVLIDFGSGLGYLSELLYKLSDNVIVLGLESDKYRVEAAKKRVKSYMPANINSVQYREQFITEKSKDFIVDAIEELLKLNYNQALPEQVTTRMAIIGLHACADLSITSMKLFFDLTKVQHLIIMPCCYHKLQINDDSSSTTPTATTNALKFKHFPISESLKKVLLENECHKANYKENNEHYSNYLNRPFLRLACQQTLKRWSRCSQQEHCLHGCEMFLRAVAESLKQEEEEMELIVVKRKGVKIDFSSLDVEHKNSFEVLSRIFCLKSIKTKSIVPWKECHRIQFDEITKQYLNGCKLAEGLTCLQTAFQKLCENLVLYDRLCYMEETALKLNINIKVRYEKIMDENLSPRCYALIAEKL